MFCIHNSLPPSALRESRRVVAAAVVDHQAQVHPEVGVNGEDGVHPVGPGPPEIAQDDFPVNPIPLLLNEGLVNLVDIPEGSLGKSLRGIPGVLYSDALFYSQSGFIRTSS